MVSLNKQKDENEEKFIWRLCSAKDSGLIDMSWTDIADIINQECRKDSSEYRNESAYRKPYQEAKRFFDAGVFSDIVDQNYIKELRNIKSELRKEKQKVFDERTALRKIDREQGRRESMFDIMKRAIDNHVDAKFEFIPNMVQPSECDFIIHLTDVHCGMNIQSTFNVFNVDILKERLIKYLHEIYELVELYHPENGFLILGGDMIHGLIHLNSRIEAKENVAEQIMIAADLVGNFIDTLRRMFKMVYVHTTAGNHSRAVSNKDEAIKGENFDLLIPYVCKKEFKHVDNVEFVKNYLDSDIATFEVRGHMVYAAHGNRDSTKTVVYNMTKFARKAHLRLPDMCFLGHRHTNGLVTVDDVKVIQSGCVDGMDNYSVDKRLVGTPEQSVTVVTKEKMIKAFCDIQID